LQSSNLATKALNSNVVTMTTSAAHGLVVGENVIVTDATLSYNVTNKALTSNVATLTIGTHRFLVGTSVTIAGVDATFNGTYTINAVAATTISYTLIATNVTSTSATNTGLVVTGAASQSGSLQTWTDSANTVLAQITSGGSMQSGANITAGTLTALGRLTVNTGATGTIGAVIRGVASQSANLIEIQDSTGATLTRVNNTGIIITNQKLIVGAATGILGTSSLYANDASTIALAVRGAASQSANLQEWQDSAGTVLASVSSAGLVFGKAADATLATATTGIGYMGLPQNSTTTGSYTIVAADAGEHIYASATRTITIPANSALALPIGTTLTFIAGAGATMTIAITTDTMYLAGAGTTGSRTLAAHGIATAVKTTATTWIISGNGLT
jgi:hypothetical protein